MSDQEIFLRGTRHVVSDCISCGVVYTVPKSLWDNQREKGGSHYCPNGHSQGWTPGKNTENDQLRQERDRLTQQLAFKDDEIKRQRERREAADRREAAARGQITKLKKRAAAGVCPCCNRTFSNMHRHMQTKHPEFRNAPDLKIVGQS